MGCSAKFKEKSAHLFESFGSHKVMVLATGDNNRISARSMSVIIFNGKMYFQTDVNSCKYNCLINNDNVALCFNNVSIEGKAKKLGHPLENKNFCDLYSTNFKGSFNSYTSLANEMLFEVSPVIIKLWVYEEGIPYLEVYNFADESYQKIKQDIME